MEFLCELAEVETLVKEFYNMEIVQVEYLEGFEDLNVRLQTRSLCDNDVQEVVLKLSPLINPKVQSSVDLQTQMIEYLAENGVPVPKVVRTITDCRFFTRETTQGRKLCGRMLTYIPGEAFSNVSENLSVLEDIGGMVGKMDTVLKNFVPSQHENIDTEWGLSKVLLLRDILPRYCPEDFQVIGTEILSDFETKLLPVLHKFQTGYIHSDLIGSNIYVTDKNDAATGEKKCAISGMIDFGDACLGTYVYEIAILMADLMAHQQQSALDIGRRLFCGFCLEFRLNTEELSCLRLCICIRLLQCYVLTEKAALANPSNRKYITRYQLPYKECCKFLWTIQETEFHKAIISAAPNVSVESKVC